MGAMVTNHMYNKEHNTTEIDTDLAANKLPANSSLPCPSVYYVCVSAGYSNDLQEYEANRYINKQYNQLK